MKSKAQRLATIQHIISTQKVSSQEELLQLMENLGFVTTQATLSRDLKFLKVAKIPHPDKGYVYELPSLSEKSSNDSSDDFPIGGVESINYSGNLVVIKTRPGFANGVASIIDTHDPYEILGTIAGDDTILLVMREGVSRGHIFDTLSTFIPGLKNKEY
ncbi:transcriptional regulator, ArgR family [Saccharicrinis carchari]|uniref:Arginine repressor n=1 Tax=Saccharicrinis carchari TaxID=1168039 RepID=A0A521C1A7_SACCC|nr:ArgR family transcriptional regulator [Saccharicrinis carchari]SMO53158.1 transcriptional regulator, ArgR family [Saccharicrinis carchari]